MDEPAPEAQDAPDAVAEVHAVEPIWLIVAQAPEAYPYGENHEPRAGLRWFAGGAKLYVVGGFFGTGMESVTVVGHHRRSKRLTTIHVTSRSLVRWRVELVYRPAVIRIARYGEDYDPFRYEKDGERRSADGSDECRQHLERVVRRFTSVPVRARLRGGPRDGQEVELGPGEPPAQLLVADPAEKANGVRYRRRAWDNARAFYDHAPSWGPGG